MAVGTLNIVELVMIIMAMMVELLLLLLLVARIYSGLQFEYLS